MNDVNVLVEREREREREDSPRNSNNSDKPFDWKPLLIGGIIVGVIVIIGLIFYFIKRNKHHE